MLKKQEDNLPTQMAKGVIVRKLPFCGKTPLPLSGSLISATICAMSHDFCSPLVP